MIRLIALAARGGALHHQIAADSWLPPRSLGSCRWRWRGARSHRGTMLERFYRHSLSKDAQQTLVVLVAAKNDPQKLESVAKERLCRLLKEDLLPILYTLFEGGHAEVATKVFHHIQKEVWYRPDGKFYRVIVRAFMDGSSFQELNRLWEEMELRGCRLDRKLSYELMEDAIVAKQYALAFRIFETLKSEMNVSKKLYWRIIDCLNRCGEFDKSLKLEEEMLDEDQGGGGGGGKNRCKSLLGVGVHKLRPWAS